MEVSTTCFVHPGVKTMQNPTFIQFYICNLTSQAVPHVSSRTAFGPGFSSTALQGTLSVCALQQVPSPRPPAQAWVTSILWGAIRKPPPCSSHHECCNLSLQGREKGSLLCPTAQYGWKDMSQGDKPSSMASPNFLSWGVLCIPKTMKTRGYSYLVGLSQKWIWNKVEWLALKHLLCKSKERSIHQADLNLHVVVAKHETWRSEFPQSTTPTQKYINVFAKWKLYSHHILS